jgi:hypothetical protein
LLERLAPGERAAVPDEVLALLRLCLCDVHGRGTADDVRLGLAIRLAVRAGGRATAEGIK